MASIIKRGNYWRAQIRRRGYPVQNNTFDTKVQAESWARSVETAMDRGLFVSLGEAQRTTLAESLQRYGREISSTKHHPQQDLQRIRHWLRQPMAANFLANLRGTDFAKYRDDRLAEGLAPNTVRLELALVSHMFEIARKEWGMEGLLNPLKNIRKPSGSRERDRRLNPGEYERLAKALGEHENPWLLPLFDMAIETSLRQGMLFVLRWDWVDLNKRVIYIPSSYRNKGNKGVPAALPLSTKAIAVLSALPRNLNCHIFGTTQNATVCAWKRTIKRLGIQDLHWHDLRHEAASRLFEKGLNPMEVASITGHKNLNMLRRYTHLNPENLAHRLG